MSNEPIRRTVLLYELQQLLLVLQKSCSKSLDFRKSSEIRARQVLEAAADEYGAAFVRFQMSLQVLQLYLGGIVCAMPLWQGFSKLFAPDQECLRKVVDAIHGVPGCREACSNVQLEILQQDGEDRGEVEEAERKARRRKTRRRLNSSNMGFDGTQFSPSSEPRLADYIGLEEEDEEDEDLFGGLHDESKGGASVADVAAEQRLPEEDWLRRALIPLCRLQTHQRAAIYARFEQGEHWRNWIDVQASKANRAVALEELEQAMLLRETQRGRVAALSAVSNAVDAEIMALSSEKQTDATSVKDPSQQVSQLWRKAESVLLDANEENADAGDKALVAQVSALLQEL